MKETYTRNLPSPVELSLKNKDSLNRTRKRVEESQKEMDEENFKKNLHVLGLIGQLAIDDTLKHPKEYNIGKVALDLRECGLDIYYPSDISEEGDKKNFEILSIDAFSNRINELKTIESQAQINNLIPEAI